MKRNIHHLFFPIAVLCSQLVWNKQLSLLTAATAKAASPEARKREKVREREIIHSSRHSLGHGESGEPAPASPTRFPVYIPLLMGNTLSSDVC